MPRQEAAATGPEIPEDAMREAVRSVLELRAQNGEGSGNGAPEAVGLERLDTCRMADFGVDSLLIAEIVVGLEERLDTLLEITSGTDLETFGELRSALRPTGES
ncbi:hypothetical protein [Streptomyces sp. PU-14G]|uniref:hypothetical protein n=1 Tax=Streptomyces sp. PU-14G TaxID=2800808 RepID=UPI0034DFBFA8